MMISSRRMSQKDKDCMSCVRISTNWLFHFIELIWTKQRIYEQVIQLNERLSINLGAG